MDFPHPRVYLRLCWVVDILGGCRCASRGLLLLQGGSWRAVPVDQQRASAGTRTRGRDRVFHNSVMGLGLWDGGRPGHRGTRHWVRWWRKRRCPGGVCRLVVPERLHWGCCGRVILRVSARPLVARKVSASVPSDCQVHSIVAVAIPAGMHGCWVSVLLVCRIMVSIIMQLEVRAIGIATAEWVHKIGAHLLTIPPLAGLKCCRLLLCYRLNSINLCAWFVARML